jgi:hypothetical protein
MNVSINLYLQKKLSPSLKLFEELMKTWSGFRHDREKMMRASMN